MGRKSVYTKETYYEKLLKELPESDFTLNVYNGTEKPCEITCNLCGSHYTFSQALLLYRRASRGNKNVCKKCENNAWTKAQKDAKNKAQYLLKAKGSIIPVEEPKSWASRELSIWKCLKCNHTFKRAPAVMFSFGSLSCPWCETHPFEYSEEMIKQKSEELWGSEYSVLSIDALKNPNGSKRITVSHNKCGFKYSVNLWNYLHGQGCPRCRASHGEKKVRDYLNNNNFQFQEQYVIDVNNTYLKLDFYLEENGKKYAIEYNGIQHYQPVDYFGGENSYKSQIYRDNLKKEYCLKNNIELIIIPYHDETIISSEELAQRLRGQAA